MPRATWLTFRRTYSCWAHDKGVAGKIVVELMGHANVDTTLNVYTQVLAASLRAAVAKVGDELFTIDHSGIGDVFSDDAFQLVLAEGPTAPSVNRFGLSEKPRLNPLAEVLRAALAYLDHDLSRARARLVSAIQGFDRAGMRLYEAATRRRLSELSDEQAVQAGRRDADRWMTDEGIVNPARMTRLIAPGFADSGPGDPGHTAARP